MNSLQRTASAAALTATAALALALAGGATERPASNADTAPAVRELAIVRGHDLFTVRSDGSGLTRLTRTAELESAPAWSPDGTRLVFVREARRNADLYVADPAGRNARRITHTPSAREYTPSWSPDGRWIAFASDRSGEFELYVIRPDGTGTRRVTAIARRGYPSYVPIWSPDGRLLVFSSSARRRPRIPRSTSCAPTARTCGGSTRTKGNAEVLGDDAWRPGR